VENIIKYRICYPHKPIENIDNQFGRKNSCKNYRRGRNLKKVGSLKEVNTIKFINSNQILGEQIKYHLHKTTTKSKNNTPFLSRKISTSNINENFNRANQINSKNQFQIVENNPKKISFQNFFSKNVCNTGNNLQKRSKSINEFKRKSKK